MGTKIYGSTFKSNVGATAQEHANWAKEQLAEPIAPNLVGDPQTTYVIHVFLEMAERLAELDRI